MEKKSIHFNCARHFFTVIFLSFYVSLTMAQDVPTGFASVAGDGLSTTTGGDSASPVTVHTYAELSSAVSGTTPRVIIVSGTIRTTDGGGFGLPIGSNITIKGADKNATIYGGINISGSSNVIIRNLNFHGIYPSAGPDDAIAVNNSHHVWLDHLNIWDAGDGNLDITNQSSYVTVSWCKFWYTTSGHPHRFNSLIGSGGGDHPEDWGRLKVTYHHNWFANLVHERMPRLTYGQAHTYNNYYTASGNNYCIGVGSYGSMLIENNYFKSVKSPHIFLYDVWCYIVARGNVYSSTTGTTNSGLGGNRDVAGQEGFDVEPFNTPPYAYTLDSAANVPSIVSSGAGPFPEVANTAPAVSITSPISNATFNAPANITVSANATDTTGTITKVQFFQGSTSLGIDSSAPYSISWNNVPAGNYTLQAVATDNGGLARASSFVNIFVNDPNASGLTIQENTTGFCAFDGTIDTGQPGYTGAGYVNTGNAVGQGMSYNINFPQTGDYTFYFRYAANTDRPAQLLIDGTTVIANIPFASTTTWTNWTEIAAGTLSVTAGTHTIRLEGTTTGGTGNMDYIRVIGATNPTAANCSGTLLLSSTMQESAVANAKNNLEVKCYPVPADNLLYIEFSSPVAETVNISLIDATGRTVRTTKANGLRHSMNISGLPRGLYVVKISGTGMNIIKHITKQ
jgi:pectate lyase